MKRLFAITLALLMAFGLIACGGTGAPKGTSADEPAKTTGEAATKSKYDERDTIVFGVVSSMTGERAQNGEFAKEAMDMWVEEINEAGGILGKKVEVRYEDDQSIESSAANAFQKMVSSEEVSGIIGNTFSAMTLAQEPYIREYKVPFITGGSSSKMATLGNDFLWQIRYNDALAGGTMAKAAVEKLGMKKPALMHSTDSFGQGLADSVKENLVKLGIKEEDILVLSYTVGEKNYTPMIAQIQQSDSDGLICVAHQVEGSLIVSQVHSAGLKLPLMGSTTFCSEIVINNAGIEASNDWYSASDWTPTVEDEPGKTFIDNYVKRYGHKPDLPSYCAWDAAVLFKAAIENGKSADPVTVNEEIKKLKDVKGVGSIYSPHPDDHICATTQFLTKNVDGVAVIQDMVKR